jgi:hypothetical protein
MKYNYYEAVKEDVREALKDRFTIEEIMERISEDRESFLEDLEADMWTDDSVTGNGSGSYWFNTWKAEEALCHNWEEIVNVASEFGYEAIISDGYEYGAEWWDVSIRCYYLSSALSDVLEEIEATQSFTA